MCDVCKWVVRDGGRQEERCVDSRERRREVRE